VKSQHHENYLIASEQKKSMRSENNRECIAPIQLESDREKAKRGKNGIKSCITVQTAFGASPSHDTRELSKPMRWQ
jgi:hypothetical protein